MYPKDGVDLEPPKKKEKVIRELTNLRKNVRIIDLIILNRGYKKVTI
jgi:hypothetical protein